MPDSLPRALELARENRRALRNDRFGRVSTFADPIHFPNELYGAACEAHLDDGDATRDLYSHAMIESAMIVDHDGRAINPCPRCGWDADA